MLCAAGYSLCKLTIQLLLLLLLLLYSIRTVQPVIFGLRISFGDSLENSAQNFRVTKIVRRTKTKVDYYVANY